MKYDVTALKNYIHQREAVHRKLKLESKQAQRALSALSKDATYKERYEFCKRISDLRTSVACGKLHLTTVYTARALIRSRAHLRVTTEAALAAAHEFLSDYETHEAAA